MDEIGQRLRAARIEKGLTIDDLQQSTKIQKRYLIAIEEGQLNQLPGEFYERAFMKQYAEAVGLDSRELLGDTVIEVPQETDNEVKKIQKTVKEDKRKPNEQSDRTMDFIKKYLPQAIVILLVIIILGAIFGIATQNRAKNQTVIPDKSESIKKDNDKKKADKKADEEAAKKKEADKKAAADKKAKEDKEKEDNKFSITEDKNDANKFTLKNLPDTDNKLTLTGGSSDAWVEVKIDNSNAWSGVLKASGSQEVAITDGAKVISVHSGNSRATNIKINDTVLPVSDLATGSFVRTFTLNIEE